MEVAAICAHVAGAEFAEAALAAHQFADGGENAGMADRFIELGRGHQRIVVDRLMVPALIPAAGMFGSPERLSPR